MQGEQAAIQQVHQLFHGRCHKPVQPQRSHIRRSIDPASAQASCWSCHAFLPQVMGLWHDLVHGLSHNAGTATEDPTPKSRALGERQVVQGSQLERFRQHQLPRCGLLRAVLAVGVEDVHCRLGCSLLGSGQRPVGHLQQNSSRCCLAAGITDKLCNITGISMLTS